jgi:hypothetical protein
LGGLKTTSLEYQKMAQEMLEKYPPKYGGVETMRQRHKDTYGQETFAITWLDEWKNRYEVPVSLSKIGWGVPAPTIGVTSVSGRKMSRLMSMTR